MAKRNYLGGFELMVVLALMRLGEDAYGVPISREIEERSGREVALGSVYAALERLEEKEFVTSRLGDSTPARGGRAKRYFHVTGKGLREIGETHRTLKKFVARSSAIRRQNVMKSLQPPAFATWLLKQLCSGQYSDALAGDSVEEYQRGRSESWYWRQVLVAIVGYDASPTRPSTAAIAEDNRSQLANSVSSCFLPFWVKR